MRKEFELVGCVEVQPEISEDMFLDALIEFVESKGWFFGGGVREIRDGFYLHPDGTRGEPVVKDDGRRVYRLIITDTENTSDRYAEDFDIGVFTTAEEAEATARHYLDHVAGFSTLPCSYRVEERRLRLFGPDRSPKRVWLVQGWNYNTDGDEIDLIESDCFLSEDAAKGELAILRKQTPRSQWLIMDRILGQCEWAEGFVRS